MNVRGALLVGCLWTTTLVACGGADTIDADPSGDAGHGGDGGGGEGGDGGSPFSYGSANDQLQWHRAIRCVGSSRSTFSSLQLLAGRPTVGGWVDGHCALFEGAVTATDDEEPMAAALEPNGELAWSARYAAPGGQRFHRIAAAGAGLALVGWLDAAFDLGSIHIEPLPSGDVPNSTLFLARSDEAGTPLWAKTFPLNAIFANARVAGGSNGDTLLATSAEHDVDFGGGMLAGNIFSSYLVRYDEAGEHLFSQVVESSSGFHYTAIDSLAVDGAGNSWVVGRFSDDVSIGGASLTHPGPALFLAVVDRAGVRVGGRVIEASDCVLSLRAAPSGMLLGGTCHEPVDFGAGPVGSSDGSALVARYDTGGELMWTHDLGSAVDSLSFDAVTGGGALVAGAFVDELVLGDDHLVSAGRRDAFVAVLSATGSVESAQRFGGEYDEIIEDVRADAGGWFAMGTGLLENDDPSQPYPLLEVARFTSSAD